MQLGQLFVVVLSLWSVSVSFGIVLLCVLAVCLGWPLSALSSPCCLRMCPCGPSSKAFSLLAPFWVVPFCILFPTVLSPVLGWHLPFPSSACNRATLQFIHKVTLCCVTGFSLTLSCSWSLVHCPRAGSSLELRARAEPSLNHPMETGGCTSPWGAVRNHAAPCAASEADSARFT